ncbi:MAG: hypothetical protein K2J15_02580, partial [Muribaculaceae bacterium]|nr:hypothetical protein [Muribaculaceae bacterium]
MARTSLELNQRLNQRLSQQQVRFVRLLELSAPEMDDAVERELEANPALTAIDKADASSGENIVDLKPDGSGNSDYTAPA